MNVDKYAAEGLRTLYLAERYLEEEEFSVWFEKSRQAKLSLTNREEEVAKIDELIEINLELVGSTAIEDRLQDKVADTIHFMKNVGIKVWVLTGDKIETAINIGVSAGLLDRKMA
jgi:magnesium-transporting ATPase (P-type)